MLFTGVGKLSLSGLGRRFTRQGSRCKRGQQRPGGAAHREKTKGKKDRSMRQRSRKGKKRSRIDMDPFDVVPLTLLETA